MIDKSQIREHMNVVGADGVHIGTVDKVEGEYVKLTRNDSPQTQDGQGARHRTFSLGLVAEVEGDTLVLSATAANAELLEEDTGGADGGNDGGPTGSATGGQSSGMGSSQGGSMGSQSSGMGGSSTGMNGN